MTKTIMKYSLKQVLQPKRIFQRIPSEAKRKIQENNVPTFTINMGSIQKRIERLLPKEQPKIQQMSFNIRNMSIIRQIYSIQCFPNKQISHQLQQLIPQITKKLLRNQYQLHNLVQKQNNYLLQLSAQIEFIKKNINTATELCSQEMLLWIKQLNDSSQHIENIDKKINLFINTVKGVHESLRTTKLKIQNLQLFHQNTEALNFSNISSIKQCVNTNQQYGFNKKIPQNIYQAINHINVIDKSRKEIKQKNNSYQNDKRSPFETNAFISQSQKTKISTSFQIDSTEDTNRLLLQQMNLNKQANCWIDQMGYLRRSNLTYIMDQFGNVKTANKERKIKPF